MVRADGAVIASKAVMQQLRQQREEREHSPQGVLAAGVSPRGPIIQMPISHRKAAQQQIEAEKRRLLRENDSSSLREFVRRQRQSRRTPSDSPRSSEGPGSSSEGAGNDDAAARLKAGNKAPQPPELHAPSDPPTAGAHASEEEHQQLLSTLHEGLNLPASQDQTHPVPEQVSDQALLRPRFLRPDGEEVLLPVGDRDSLSYRIEALRIYLERELGLKDFVAAYRHLQSESTEAAGTSTSQPLASQVSEKTMQFLPLIHQLIVCEDRCFVQ